jgi:ATP-dependent Lhr-like helicase
MSRTTAFHPSIQDWFDTRFDAPTAVQAQSWPLIAAGDHVLATAPTGSGKTLTAFLWSLNQYASGAWEPGHTRVLYISPLKALNTDIRENLLKPLADLKADSEFPDIRVQTRSGDTPASDRQRMLRKPPEILITTPESLSLLLTTRNGMNALTRIETVILDEVHAVVDNRRGVQLMTSLERLVELSGEFQRLALSATVEPLEAVAAYVGGFSSSGEARAVTTVRATGDKQIEFRVRFPEEVRQAVENGKKIWDPMADSFRDLIDHNTSTLFFTNSRRLAEKITLKINEDQPGPVAYAHHGSLARDIRTTVEQRLKGGELKAIVATSSLEMGIDIGHLDEVVMIQSPPSVAATLQRIGRAGHRVNETSRGTLFPTHAQDFLEAAVLAEAIPRRDIEPLEPLMGSLDVLAQIVISCTAHVEWQVNDLFNLLRRATPYRNLSREHFELVIEMLAGRYAGSRVRELKPRISYDRIHQSVRALKSAVLAFYSNGGTIPDRGYYQLRHNDSGAVIGELDEEFVWEASVGQTFAFGTQNWQVNRITHNDVMVRPAPPGSQAPPFWRSETFNRSFHFSERIGHYLETADTALAGRKTDKEDFVSDLVEERGFESTAAEELTDYLERQREATGTSLPHRHHVLIETIRTGPGGYRGPNEISQIVVHTFWGGRLNRPWALALGAALEEKWDGEVEIHADNNAIAIQLKTPLDPAELISLVRVDNMRALLRGSLERSGFFGARFRECAGRALLLTRARFNQRLPLWMSRLQAKKLMTTVSSYTDFPVLLETWRTCLNDEFDLDSLETMLTEIQDGLIGWSHVTSQSPSPFSANITFDQINRYMYADDSPEAQGTSSLSDRLIADTIANEHLRPRLKASTVTAFEEKRQRRHPEYAPSETADWQEWVKERILIPAPEYFGPEDGLARIEVDHRIWFAHPEVLHGLIGSGLITAENTSGEIAEVGDPRTAAQFAAEILSFYGPLSMDRIGDILPSLPGHLFADEDAWVVGPLLEDSDTICHCDATNYEILLRFQRAALRPEVTAKPVSALPAAMARWQGFGTAGNLDNLTDALTSLRGFSASVKAWLGDFLPARFGKVEDGRIDEALQSAELGWFGTAMETITVAYPEDVALFREATDAATRATADLTKCFTDPSARYSFQQLADSQSEPLDSFSETFWTAVWQGVIHADTLTPLRQGMARGFKLDSVTGNATAMRRARRGALRGARGFAGNWQLSPVDEETIDPLTELEDDKDRARLLLDRYGFLCRELANREGGRLRWARLFRALCMMELSGEIVSGYFYEQLTGPQFMTPAALQNFSREHAGIDFWCNATDPASPCGLGLADPDLPQRRAQNYLSYIDGGLALVIENLGRRLHFHLPPDHPRLVEAMEPLAHLVRRERRLAVETINAADSRTSPYLAPIQTILKGVKDHKQIYLESE